MYKSFREMPVWREAMDVAEEIFSCTEKLPRKEDYGFTSQIRRSALSISANIAEAYGRQHSFDKKTSIISQGDPLRRLRVIRNTEKECGTCHQRWWTD